MQTNTFMSAAQAIASQQFLDAMGYMVSNEQKVNQVMNYIIQLRNETEPCQFSVDEMKQILADGTAAARRGEGMPHAQFVNEVESWLK